VRRWGGAYYGKKYTAWREEAAAFLEENFQPKLRPQRPYFVIIDHYVRRPRTSTAILPVGDIDNYDKAALDAIVKAELMVDDRWISKKSSNLEFARNEDEVGTYIKYFEDERY
jgi:Holliday junction resolvase RusA-like endonuclease